MLTGAILVRLFIRIINHRLYLIFEVSSIEGNSNLVKQPLSKIEIVLPRGSLYFFLNVHKKCLLGTYFYVQDLCCSQPQSEKLISVDNSYCETHNCSKCSV